MSRFGFCFLFWKKREGRWLLAYDGMTFLPLLLGGLFLAASSGLLPKPNFLKALKMITDNSQILV